MSTLLLAAIGFPWAVLKWIWNGLQFGRNNAMLIRERKRLNRLKELETNHSHSLAAGDSHLIRARLVKIGLLVGEGVTEPYIAVHVEVFNGTVFTMELVRHVLKLDYSSHGLHHPNTLTEDRPTLVPGGVATLQFQQPVQVETAATIRGICERRDQISWGADVNLDFRVVELEVEHRVSRRIKLRERPLSTTI